MDIIAKNKTLIWVIVILSVLNVITLSSFWFMYLKRPRIMPRNDQMPMPPDRMRGDVDDFLRQELNLTNEQSEKFEQMQREHFKQIDDIFQQIRDTKKSLMDDTFVDSPDKQIVDKLISEISGHFAEIEKLHYQHFTELKSILNKDQQDKLREIFNDIEPMMGPPMRGGRRHKHGGPHGGPHGDRDENHYRGDGDQGYSRPRIPLY